MWSVGLHVELLVFPTQMELWARSAYPKAIPRKQTTMMVESVWRWLKRISLALNNRPRLNFVVHIIATESVPAYRVTFANVTNRLRMARTQGLTAEQKSFKKSWICLRAKAIKGQYDTDNANWICGCGAQKYHAHLLCKHLVACIPIPPIHGGLKFCETTLLHFILFQEHRRRTSHCMKRGSIIGSPECLETSPHSLQCHTALFNPHQGWIFIFSRVSSTPTLLLNRIWEHERSGKGYFAAKLRSFHHRPKNWAKSELSKLPLGNSRQSIFVALSPRIYDLRVLTILLYGNQRRQWPRGTTRVEPLCSSNVQMQGTTGWYFDPLKWWRKPGYREEVGPSTLVVVVGYAYSRCVREGIFTLSKKDEREIRFLSSNTSWAIPASLWHFSSCHCST